jgi:Rrf2 family transcriptional regulator, cysteine metabolism repressor
MRLSRASAYALGAVLQLGHAPPGMPIPCSQLAKHGQMPERFLLQVLRSLVNHGILVSTRGVDGGYALARSLDEISLLQILEATEGPQVPVIPPLDAIPESSRENLQEVLRDVTAAASKRMNEVMLSSLHSAKRKSNAETAGAEQLH